MSIIKHNLPEEETQLIEVIENDLLLPQEPYVDYDIAPPRELLFSEIDEAMLYHDAGRNGFAAIMVKENGRMKQKEMFPVSQLPEVIQCLPKNTDTFLSQSEFNAKFRRAVTFLRTETVYQDFDIYKINRFDGMTPEKAVDEVLDYCTGNYIPWPSLFLFSGGGLYAKWLLDEPIPRARLGEWELVEKTLQAKMLSIGADPHGILVTQVLRLVNTVNTKYTPPRIVRVVWQNRNHQGEFVRWSLDELKQRIIPHSVDEYREQQAKEIEALDKRTDIPKKIKEQRKYLIKHTSAPAYLQTKDLTTLLTARTQDIVTIAKEHFRGSKGFKGIPKGYRGRYMFLLYNTLAPITRNRQELSLEINALKEQLTPDLSAQELKNVLCTAQARYEQYLRGEKIIYNGKKRSPIYHFTTKELIRLLGVTEDIQKRCFTIIGPEEKQRRDTRRKEAKRRADGVQEREAYEARVKGERQQHTEKARMLHNEGKSLKEIALEMGKSYDTIKTYLYRKVV